MAEKVAEKMVEKVNSNLTSFAREQKKAGLEITRGRDNMALVKKILMSDEMSKVLSAQSIKDASFIDVDPIEYVEKPKKGKKGDGHEGTPEVNAIDVATPPIPKSVVPKVKAKMVTPKVVPPRVTTPKEALTQKTPASDSSTKAGGSRPSGRGQVEEGKGQKKAKDDEPEAKRPKRSVTLESDEEDEEFEEEGGIDESDAFGEPQPNSNVILSPSNKNGRRVYSIIGSDNPVVKGGTFLLYDVVNVYQFSEDDLKAAKVVTMREGDVEHMTELASTTSMTVDGAVTFVKELLTAEAAKCKRPTFLERPLVSMRDLELKVLFNELPEPIRSALHKYCKEVNLFKVMDRKKLALLLDEVAQRIEPFVSDLRLEFPAVSVAFDTFQHATFVSI